MPYHVVTGKIIESEFKIDREELAWAAGIFDGEGGTYIRKPLKNNHNHKIILIVTQREKGMLIRFNRIIGNKGFLSRNNIGIWKLKVSNFESVQSIIAMLWFKLFNVKKQQYIEVRNIYINNYRKRERNKWNTLRWMASDSFNSI